jgi:hypothetical protein
MTEDPVCDEKQKHEQRVVVRYLVKQGLLVDLADVNCQGIGRAVTGQSGFVGSILPGDLLITRETKADNTVKCNS